MPTVTIQEAINVGLQHQRAGRFADAEKIYLQVLGLDPNNAQALHLIGLVYQQQGKDRDAVELIERAIEQNPGIPQFYFDVALSWRKLGEIREAIAALQAAINLKHDYQEAYHNLAIMLEEKGQLEASFAAYEKALHLKPDDYEAWTNMGAVLERMGRIKDAIEAWEKALKLKPLHIPARWNHAVALLLCGDYLRGWREYEWRWQNFPSRRREFTQPLWNGEDLEGKTILLHAEQGFGDTIQFVRYAPLVAARGGKVILECHAELVALLGRIEGISQTVAAGQPLPAFDLHVPLLSLPMIFRTSVKTIPHKVPYIFPDPQLVEAWRPKMQTPDNKLKVGLVWAGHPGHTNDRQRSIFLRTYAPLGRVANACFYSIQKGDAGAQARKPPPGLGLIDYTDQLNNFDDTAAMISHLDLIISVDNVVAHLSGAMGKSVWTLIPFVPDYRWMLNRTDTPWYPGMRLFRQPTVGDWPAVIQAVLNHLQHYKRKTEP